MISEVRSQRSEVRHPTSDLIYKEEKMQIKNPKFEISAVTPKQYPTNNLPEVVLVGRSNVGKSSLINAIVNRKNLARTSSEPGKTRQINFYNIDDIFYFVDLPGYGYSKMSKEEQVKCGHFIEEYLQKRQNIAVVILVIDIRHKPTDDDKAMYDYLIKTNKPFFVVTNKADKIAITKVNSAMQEIQEALNPMHDIVFMPFSSERKVYNESLLSKVQEYVL